MLDKNGNKLLKPSPLKENFFKRAGKWLFGDNEAKNDAKDQMNASMGALSESQDRVMEINTDNPYKNADNAFAGLDNKYEDLENVYEGAENVYEGKMKNAFEGQENAYEGMKNQYENMENSFEELTVNTQQAEFEKQMAQQQQANIMSQMAGAAGGSGIAALAQSMAQQGQLQAQKASATIGQQEAENARLAAEAGQKIQMATAGEGSKIAMAQAGEQSRLDTTANQAEMDIQKTVLGAEESLQARRLSTASDLQMAEADAAHELQLREAEGEQWKQEKIAEGTMWSSEMELSKEQTFMDAEASKLQASSQVASQPTDKGTFTEILGVAGQIAGAAASDIRLKENITKIKYSDSGIPIYTFKYKGGSKTWVGTMAQDLIKLGREDAVIMDKGYYKVRYDLIDVDMKEVIPSPLKQMMGADKQSQEAQTKNLRNEGTLEAGMDILSEGQRRKNWEDLQLEMKANEPMTMQVRKARDQVLRDNQKNKVGIKGAPTELGLDALANSEKFLRSLFDQVKRWQDTLYVALQNDDKELQKKVDMNLALLKTMVGKFKEATIEFYEDHFAPETFLSKSVSAQQISFGTQIYCENPRIVFVHAEERDVANGRKDYYGNAVVENHQYAIVEDFYGNHVMINVLDGNKDCYLIDPMKAVEYLNFLNEMNEKAVEGRKAKEVTKIPLGSIDYKINSLFGYNDGSATRKQDETVMQFTHDDALFKDGSHFVRHLYEHPNIQNLNYGGFDFETMEFNQPLGPGDKNYWYDQIDNLDRIRLVDAIVNRDNPFFDIKLLRTLVKEYYTNRIETAWWKGMGYEEGKLDVMRLKAKELIKERFKQEKAKAAQNGMEEFEFDGKVYPTGADLKKMKKEREQAVKQAEKQAGVAPGTTPLT